MLLSAERIMLGDFCFARSCREKAMEIVEDEWLKFKESLESPRLEESLVVEPEEEQWHCNFYKLEKGR